MTIRQRALRFSLGLLAFVAGVVNGALAYNRLGNNTLAEDYLRRALKLDPTNAAIHLNLGLLLGEQGKKAEAIAAFAGSEKLDLIVMGTHGHSAIGNVVLGSVANGVLARCKAPVLLIR